MKEHAGTYDTARVARHEYQQRDHDREVGGGVAGLAPLTGQDLDAFLEVDEGDVEAEDVAAEACDVGESVAGVGDGEYPVHY